MPWMCLERCGCNPVADMSTIKQRAEDGTISAVSFEMYDLGSSSNLVLNPFTQVSFWSNELDSHGDFRCTLKSKHWALLLGQ